MRLRPGRLFIDYRRNGRGTTAVGAYSPRVRPGFPVAYPVRWEQGASGIRPDARRPGDRLSHQLSLTRVDSGLLS